jgi:hypothetical protein
MLLEVLGHLSMVLQHFRVLFDQSGFVLEFLSNMA